LPGLNVGYNYSLLYDPTAVAPFITVRNYKKSPHSMCAYTPLAVMISLQAGWTALNNATLGMVIVQLTGLQI
jgi:hypothetical protein